MPVYKGWNNHTTQCWSISIVSIIFKTSHVQYYEMTRYVSETDGKVTIDRRGVLYVNVIMQI